MCYGSRAATFLSHRTYTGAHRSDIRPSIGVTRDPREIATYKIPGETPHNFWLDEDNEILYAGWYGRGVRVLDVSGTLSGDLGAAGREIGFLEPSGSKGLGSIWAPQLHRGVLYLSDIYHGLWAVKPLR